MKLGNELSLLKRGVCSEAFFKELKYGGMRLWAGYTEQHLHARQLGGSLLQKLCGLLDLIRPIPYSNFYQN